MAFTDRAASADAQCGGQSRQVGEVADVLHPRSQAGQELLAVRLACDGREVLVPFVAQVVPRVDVDQGVVVIDPPEGLLEV